MFAELCSLLEEIGALLRGDGPDLESPAGRAVLAAMSSRTDVLLMWLRKEKLTDEEGETGRKTIVQDLQLLRRQLGHVADARPAYRRRVRDAVVRLRSFL